MCKLDERYGFRDVKSFNKAVLAKQGWRLICLHESLVARVSQGRYFWQNGFLSVEHREGFGSVIRKALLAG